MRDAQGAALERSVYSVGTDLRIAGSADLFVPRGRELGRGPGAEELLFLATSSGVSSTP